MRLAVIAAAVSAVVALTTSVHAQLLPPPVPAENPITEPKRILGKMLFWDEQLSSNDTISCGGCHQPASGGADVRISIHPGPDHVVPSADDIAGSQGVARINVFGIPVSDPVFGLNPQVTSRAAPTVIGAAYATDNFLDGHARTTFTNPETGTVSIVSGGGLESQAVNPFLSPVEMAHEGRTWNDVRLKLQTILPLRDATDLPPDLDAVVASHVTYPQLFAAAYGSTSITAERIAFALATYERTLVPDQTPWDRTMRGEANGMTPIQKFGWDIFRVTPCQTCHAPPRFSDQTFRNIGIRPISDDIGRQAVTGSSADAGRFKVPTLRNVGLKPTHMHNGRITTIRDAMLWYRIVNTDRFPQNLDPLLPITIQTNAEDAVVDFLTNGLTDPRVAAETFPFDRPAIHRGKLPSLTMGSDKRTLSWPALMGIQRYSLYRGALADLRVLGPDGLPSMGYGACISTTDPNTADTTFVDLDVPDPGEGFFYLKGVIDGHGVERGLGATSGGRAHFVIASCPPPS